MLTGAVEAHAETLPLPGGAATIFLEDILARKIKQQSTSVNLLQANNHGHTDLA